MKNLITCVVLFALVQNIVFAQQTRSEQVDRRSYKSKTFKNTDGSFTTELSAGFVHYKNDAGEFTEINRNFVTSSVPGYDFEVTKGLYHAYFKSDLSKPNTVAFETKGGAGMTAKLWGVAYLDISTKDYHVLQQTQPTTAAINGQEIYYQNAFTNVDVKYIYTDTKLKEEIYLTQSARNNLPNPANFGLNPANTYLVFITKLNLDIPTTSPFANGSNIRNIAYEGKHRIEFKDLRGKLKFFFQ